MQFAIEVALLPVIDAVAIAGATVVIAMAPRAGEHRFGGKKSCSEHRSGQREREAGTVDSCHRRTSIVPGGVHITL